MIGNKKPALAIALVTVFPWHQNTMAAETDATLKEMVITATKTAKIASEAPATVREGLNK